MAKDYEVATQNDYKNDLSLTGDDITRVVGHLAVVKEAVSKILKEGIDGDYAIVPGTKKKALLKPGAEKLTKLFGLGVRFIAGDKEFDRYENFAMYSYIAEVYHLKTNIVIASCEGTCNSWEKKYKERSVYRGGVFVGMEATPVCDILNTLRKMSQKRAMVGAVILATGASDYFTQDEEEIEAQAPIKKAPVKTDAARFETKGSKDPASYVIPIGKFKDKKISDVNPKELTDYMSYIASNNPSIEGKLKEFLDTAREFLATA
jgi:hypothetical protein